MRILVVHPSLPPNPGAESICTKKLIRALDAAGAEVTVVTGPGADPVAGVRLVAVPEDGASAGSRLKRLWNRFPESGWDWAVAAGAAISRELASRPFDALYTRSMPFASQLAGYFAQIPRHVLWAAHFSDPWPDDEFFGDKRSRWRFRWLHRILSKSQLVTFPCERVARHCQERHWSAGPGKMRRRLIVPHVLPDSPLPERSRPAGDRKIAFLHCGTFYGRRQADTLLSGWAEWLRQRPALRCAVELIHSGPRSERFDACAKRSQVSDTVAQVGPASYEESLQRMVDADVLILVESDIEPGIYLPSKFVDYLWARKPIVAVTGRQSTVTDTIGFDYPFRASPSSVPEITGALDRAFESLNTCRSDAIQTLASLHPQFSPQTVANDLLEALAEMCGPDSAESSNRRYHWATKAHLIAR